MVVICLGKQFTASCIESLSFTEVLRNTRTWLDPCKKQWPLIQEEKKKSQRGCAGGMKLCGLVLLGVKRLSFFGESGQAESLQLVEDLPTGAVEQA